METRTRIVEVLHQDGRTARPPRNPHATLFEICDGEHAGKRGADTELFDLVGALDWDREWYAVYETGEHVRWEDITKPMNWRDAEPQFNDAMHHSAEYWEADA